MKCPFCVELESKVIDSRPTDDSRSIRRRRECMGCGRRFTTYEKVEEVPLLVIKKDGSREAYCRNKVLKGIVTACEGRFISIEKVEEVVDKLENDINKLMLKEVESVKIGELIMQYLKELDDVAYVRFASVYKNFKDLESFMAELNKLMEERTS